MDIDYEFKIETSIKLEDETNKFVSEIEILAKEHNIKFVATITIGGDMERERFKIVPYFINSNNNCLGDTDYGRFHGAYLEKYVDDMRMDLMVLEV